MASIAYVALTRGVAHGAETSGGARVIASRTGRRVMAALVVSNFAVALAVAITGVLLTQSYQRLSAIDVGFGTDGVIAGSIGLPAPQYGDNAALVAAYDRLTAAVEEIPGVEQAGLASTIPLGQTNNDTFVVVEGHPTLRDDGRAHSWLTRATEGYFGAMGVRIVEGRAFEPADHAAGRAF